MRRQIVSKQQKKYVIKHQIGKSAMRSTKEIQETIRGGRKGARVDCA